MSDRYLDNLLPDFGEYSLDAVLESCRRRASAPAAESAPPEPVKPAEAAEAIARRSRQIVMEALGETLSQNRKVPELDFSMDELDQIIDSVGSSAPSPAPEPEPAPEEPVPPPEETVEEPTEEAPLPEPEQAEQPPAPDKPKKPRIHVSPDGVITLDIEFPQDEDEEPAPEPGEVYEDEDGQDLTLDDLPEQEDAEPAGRGKRGRAGRGEDQRRPAAGTDRPSAKERFLTPLVRLFATRLARRQMQKAEAANWPEPLEFREAEELPLKRASKFYGQQLRPLRFRCRVCLFLCLILCWISLKMPMAGLLGKSVAIQAGMSLALLMTVMMASLDVLATGVRQLFDLRPGAEALATLAALMSSVDAVMIMVGYGYYQPFCAVGAVSLTAALWGERLDCLARARSMRTAAASSHPFVITAEHTDRGGKYICRSQRQAEGVVRRCEQPDLCRTVYGVAAPILMAASLGLSILACLDGRGAYFLHTFSALLCVSASFTAFLSFPLPYSLTARRLEISSAAIIGYAGAACIGKARRVVITDTDLFPPGTIAFTEINVVDAVPAQRVIASTASLLAASGSGVTSVFMELMDRRKYELVKLEEFRCHEGGGLSARVDGEQVLVGSAGFMNLMGIRIPRGMFLQNAVCTAMSGELVGVFNLSYTPRDFVQDALVTLLQGRTQPIFAIRDFNITPVMVRYLFQMPTENFNFPTFRDRYRIAASAAGMDSPIAAVLSRNGMGPMVDAAEYGRKLYNVCRIGTILSLVGSAVGMLTLFLLFRTGSFDTASAGNALSYMLLWALPVVFMAIGQTH